MLAFRFPRLSNLDNRSWNSLPTPLSSHSFLAHLICGVTVRLVFLAPTVPCGWMPGPQSRQSQAWTMAWIDRRRLAARIAALPGGAGKVVQPTQTWTPAHDDELAFLAKKRIRNFAESVLSGSFLETDATLDELEAVAEYLEKKATTDRDYERRAAKRARVAAGPRPRDLSGSSMFFVDGPGGLPDVGMVLASDSIRQVPRASDATVFVVPGMGCAPTGVLWHALLVGGASAPGPWLRTSVGLPWPSCQHWVLVASSGSRMRLSRDIQSWSACLPSAWPPTMGAAGDIHHLKTSSGDRLPHGPLSV